MRLAMLGTGTFAEPTFETLLAAGETVVGLFTQPDRGGAHKRGSTRQTGKGMATIAREAGVPVAQPESINSPEGLTALREFKPDLLVVAAYGQILKAEVLAVAPLGAINVHASLLPKYRGASPVAHAILHGDTTTGVTIIRISLGLDSGDMLAQQSLDIGPAETTGELEAQLATMGAYLCLDVVNRMKAGPVEGTKQDPALVTKAPKLTKESGLIDWTKRCYQVAHHIRAMQPWPTAYTFLHRPGKPAIRVMIARAGRWIAMPQRVPGTPVMLKTLIGNDTTPKDTFTISTGDVELLEILELQPAGGKRMTAAEFLRGYPLVEGSRFGPEEG